MCSISRTLFSGGNIPRMWNPSVAVNSKPGKTTSFAEQAPVFLQPRAFLARQPSALFQRLQEGDLLAHPAVAADGVVVGEGNRG